MRMRRVLGVGDWATLTAAAARDEPSQGPLARRFFSPTSKTDTFASTLFLNSALLGHFITIHPWQPGLNDPVVDTLPCSIGGRSADAARAAASSLSRAPLFGTRCRKGGRVGHEGLGAVEQRRRLWLGYRVGRSSLGRARCGVAGMAPSHIPVEHGMHQGRRAEPVALAVPREATCIFRGSCRCEAVATSGGRGME